MTDDISNEQKIGVKDRHESDDVLCVGTPPELDLTNEKDYDGWVRYVTGVARQYVWASFGRRMPFDVLWGKIDVKVTSDPDEIDAFYIDHLLTCNRCTEGVALAKAFVAQKENLSATMVRIFYTEVW